ncbi:hypothetical protein ScPMuIL_007712 [Solemya velum]
MANEEKKDDVVLRGGLGGGPHGLGDPDDLSLRRVESEIMIPQKMKAKAKKLCHVEIIAFGVCGKDNGFLLPFKCRKEAKQLEICLSGWYENEQFKEECKREYLEERAFYRRTGIKQKHKNLPKKVDS